MKAAVEKPFLVAARGGRPARRPVWIMRQAGRYLPEYRAVREKLSFLDLCRDPAAAALVTLQPVRRFGMDAAILFTDLLVPLLPADVGLTYDPGPVLARGVSSERDLARLAPYDPATEVPFLLETVRAVRAELDPAVALIGFVGAPFTLAAYLVEGKGSKEWTRTRRMLHEDPALFAALQRALTDLIVPVARAQAEAGCDAIQVFDSWAGVLAPDTYAEHCLPHLSRLLSAIKETDATTIAFVNGSLQHLPAVLQTEADCLSLDWKIPIGEARRRVPSSRGIQGNLDPCALFLADHALVARVRRLLRDAGPTGHVMNLGHGITPDTDPEKVRLLVETVRNEKEVPACA